MTLNTMTYEDATDLIERKFDVKTADPVVNAMKNSGFVSVMSVPQGTGNTRRHKELPVGQMYSKHKPEGGVSVRTRVQQGYSKDTHSRSYSDSIEITIEMRQLDKTRVYKEIDFISGMYPNREDLNLSMLFSFATATEYVDMDNATIDISTGDGLALASPAHTLTGSTKTYRTRQAGNPAFSEGALELMEDTIRVNTYTNMGEQVACKPDTLWSTDHMATCNAIKRLIQSTASIADNKNEGVVNVYKGRYKHVELPRIGYDQNGSIDASKNQKWGILDSNVFQIFHDVYMEGKVYSATDENSGLDIETLNWTYNTIGMHDSCIVSARGFCYSSGDGTP